MATVNCWSYTFNPNQLAPGASQWLTWGPSDAFNGASITITPRATIVTPGGGTATQVMDVGPVFTTAIPGAVAGSVDSYIGANVTNGGSATITGYTVIVTATKP